MVYIYILELEQGKYYIGKTNDPDIRLNDHFNSNGSVWTKKYKPIKVIAKIADCDNYDEDKYTKKYMDIYGIDNVRGGSWVTLVLDESTIKHLKISSTATNDRCLGCDSNGHFIKNCPNKNLPKIPITTNEFKNSCERCGYNNHEKESCFYKKDINGNFIKSYKKTYNIKGKFTENNDKKISVPNSNPNIISYLDKSKNNDTIINIIESESDKEPLNIISNNKCYIIISIILIIIFIIGGSLIGKQL